MSSKTSSNRIMIIHTRPIPTWLGTRTKPHTLTQRLSRSLPPTCIHSLLTHTKTHPHNRTRHTHTYLLIHPFCNFYDYYYYYLHFVLYCQCYLYCGFHYLNFYLRPWPRPSSAFCYCFHTAVRSFLMKTFRFSVVSMIMFLPILLRVAMSVPQF